MLDIKFKNETKDLKDLNETFQDISFWESFSPNLDIAKDLPNKVINLSKKKGQNLREKILYNGFIHLNQPGLVNATQEINKTIMSLVRIGLPPVFIFIYDEPWKIQYQTKNIVKKLIDGNYKLLPDFWAWHVEQGESGWKEHRDKGAKSMFDDNSPKSLTLWVPLTNAFPENSCMYILPANKDRHYSEENPPNLSFGFPGNLSDIQALPAKPNDVLIWNQKVVHWGSTSNSSHSLGPRISLAFEFQRDDVEPFNKPLIDPNSLPTYNERLQLIGKQIIQYTHMYGFNENLVDLAKLMLKAK
jgi:hypothetical protein